MRSAIEKAVVNEQHMLELLDCAKLHGRRLPYRVEETAANALKISFHSSIDDVLNPEHASEPVAEVRVAGQDSIGSTFVAVTAGGQTHRTEIPSGVLTGIRANEIFAPVKAAIDSRKQADSEP